jgi:hypothetical protein
MIGGASTADRNIISGNGGRGIDIDPWVGYGQFPNGTGVSDNTIQNNYIGVSSNGTQSIPNQKHGIYVYGSNRNLIMQNTVANNGMRGIAAQLVSNVGIRNQLTQNVIYNNGQIGIGC